MRPLPDLSPLPPNQTVYNQSQDDWLQILGGDLSAFDSLESSLVSESAGAAASGPGIGSSIDAMGSSLDQAISIFDTLSAADQAIDLTNTISTVATLDANLVSNFAGFHPDINVLAAPFLKEVLYLINLMGRAILSLVVSIFNQLLQMIEELFTLIL